MADNAIVAVIVAAVSQTITELTRVNYMSNIWMGNRLWYNWRVAIMSQSAQSNANYRNPALLH